MTKTDAFNLFKPAPDVKDSYAQRRMTDAMRIDYGAPYKWPDELPHRLSLQVIGAAVLAGIKIPDVLIRDSQTGGTSNTNF